MERGNLPGTTSKQPGRPEGWWDMRGQRKDNWGFWIAQRRFDSKTAAVKGRIPTSVLAGLNGDQTVILQLFKIGFRLLESFRVK